uniref:Uncharacterized protein n=1 Tax=Pseudomonas fluorescens (strain SBW25) TaxID=216595 RepID=A0A0G4E5B8_PSEFS|nr:hypothetical protein PQBR57_0421 [Pseudomonas fluorescens SBW25]
MTWGVTDSSCETFSILAVKVKPIFLIEAQGMCFVDGIALPSKSQTVSNSNCLSRALASNKGIAERK